MAVPLGKVVLPGDKFPGIPEHVDLRLGRGLLLVKGYPTAIKTGVLKFKSPQTYWIDSPDTFYVAKQGDNVIGVVTMKLKEIFRVDINQSEPANLPYMSFDHASKKNRPDIEVGDAVYAKVVKTDRHVHTELSCLSETVGRNGIYGKLDAPGVMYRGHVNYIRRLLSHKNKYLSLLGEMTAFEVAIGVNGRISIQGKSAIETLNLLRIIEEGEFLRDDEFQEYAKTKLSESKM